MNKTFSIDLKEDDLWVIQHALKKELKHLENDSQAAEEIECLKETLSKVEKVMYNI